MDANLKLIEEEFGVEIIQENGDLSVKGDKQDQAISVLDQMMALIEDGQRVGEHKVEYLMSLAQSGQSIKGENLDKEVICYTHKGRPVVPKTLGQRDYIKMIRKRDLVFGVGPAGTGKTYLAVAMAIQAYKQKDVEKIILTRPAVEAGESLGFLPGDLSEKVDPYLRPIYDALNDILGRDASIRLREKEVIEIVPLAYMRGRTLDKAFIILDEAQNTTKEQMKMFLTRMGFGSKMVVTGDITQIDLPEGKGSGLNQAIRILQGVKGIGFCYLKDVDVVRHQLVKRIIGAYERFYSNQAKKVARSDGHGKDYSRDHRKSHDLEDKLGQDREKAPSVEKEE